MREFIFRVSSKFSSWSISINNTISILKRSQYTKYCLYLILSSLLTLVIFLNGTEAPAGYYISDELRPKGSISGHVVDRHGAPIKGTQVHILGDTTVLGKSDTNGFYTVGNVSGGLHSLCFAHKDYEDDTALIDLEEGVDDTLSTSIILSYAYYIFAGKVVHKGKPVMGAGVAVAGHPVNTLTDKMGIYVLDKVPKGPSLKLLFAKNGMGFNTFKPMTTLSEDTIWVSDIELIYKGVTVSGTVYDTNGSPASDVVVAAVGGGLVDITDKRGKYKIKNMPFNEPTVWISALETNGSFGITAGVNLRDTSYNTIFDINMKPVSDVRKKNGRVAFVNGIIIVDSSTTRQFNEYPSIDINTLMQSYMWKFAQKSGSKNKTT
jgi:hypothetical protein